MGLISKLTIRNLNKNKKRTFVSLLAIIITSTLLFSIGFIFSSYREHEINEKIKNKDYDSILYEIPYSNHLILDSNKDIKHYISYTFNGNYNVLSQSNLSFYSVNDFHKIKLIRGTYPRNNGDVLLSKKVADKLHLNLSDTFTIEDKIYKVVGLYDNFYIPYTDNWYNYVFTIDTKENNNNTYFYIYLKNRKDAYTKLYNLAYSLNLKENIDKTYENMYINDELLGLYGNYSDSSKQAVIYLTLMLIMFILSVCSFFIIYNSFAICLSERKKQYGILKSVGMTNKQIRKMIFCEAMYLSAIGLPIGLLISFIMCKIVTIIINNIGVYNYVITIYPSYLIVCLIFVLLTIFYSALFPAMRASEITPIEAIRKVKDIKRKKVNPTIRKIFGVDGSITYYNMKRNKKIYRVSIISIIISILLFTFVTAYINFFNKIASLNNLETGIYINLYGNDDKQEIIKQIKDLNGIKDFVYYYSGDNIMFDNITGDMYTLEYRKTNDIYNITRFIKLDDETLSKIKRDYHITNNEPIFLNYYSKEKIEDGYITGYDKGNILKDSYNLGLCHYTYDVTNDAYYKENCTKNYKFNLINKVPKYLKEYNFGNLLIVDDTLFNKLNDNNEDDIHIYMLADDYIKMDDELKNILSKTSDYIYMNYGKENLTNYTNFIIIKIVVYSLISLFGLISIISVINVVGANLKFRRREFAILKSIGMNNKGLNKMLILEGILVCIKAFIYATPLSILLVFLSSSILKIDNNKVLFKDLFPTSYLIIFLIIVFILILIVTILVANKYKKVSLIDEIKRENI